MRDKKAILLSVLISVAMLIEGWAFVSKPKMLLTLTKGDSPRKEGDSFPLVKNEATLKEGDSFPLVKNEAEQRKLSPLDLELLGTAIGNIKDPIAFIKDLKSNKQGMYRLGNVIQEAKVVQIVMGEVTLDLNGRKETLRLSKRGMSWAGINADEIIISKNNFLSQSAEIYNSLLSITVKPHYEAQKVVGMQVNGIPEGSVITTTGIRNQDIVKSVNNQKIDSYQKALQVFSKVKNQPQVEVSLLRDGQPLNLFYRIAN
jgi:general secretion pathway protein C